jgi:hypothetical protein
MSDLSKMEAAYLFNGTAYKNADECFKAITANASNGRAAYWKHLSAYQGEVNGNTFVGVQCGLCLDFYSASNVARFAKAHFKDGFTTCSGSAGRKRPDGAAASSGPPKRARPDVEDFFAPPSVAVVAKKELYLFFFTNPTVALQLIEDPHLVASYAAMGITLPSRTTLSGIILDKVYSEVHMSTLVSMFGPSTTAAAAVPPNVVDEYGVLDLPQLGKVFVLIMDGWRRRAAAGGTPLINVLAATDTGRATYLKVSGILLRHAVTVTLDDRAVYCIAVAHLHSAELIAALHTPTAALT